MAARAPRPTDPAAPHLPVLLGPLLQAVAPVQGIWADGTFGAGGYARGLLQAGAARVIGIDRDPDVFAMAADWAAAWGDRLVLVQGEFARLDRLAAGAGFPALDGVVLDLGVSSMQVDRPERGFSFQKDGPLDMRMSQTGPDAADLIATAGEAELADILFHYGDERASRRIARAIVAARARAPITRTTELAEIVRGCLPRARPGQADPATRSFQALRIAVNDELGQLAEGLAAAERALAPGGCLAVVTFHSTEDRIVKRYLADAADTGGRGSRHGPATPERAARFQPVLRGARAADAAEIAANPRARSARLRVARRTDAPAAPPARDILGLPDLTIGGGR